MQIQPSVGWPVFRIEVPVHEKLRKRKEAEDHGVRPHFPSRFAGDGFRNAGQIGGDVHVVLITEVIDLETKFSVHLCL